MALQHDPKVEALLKRRFGKYRMEVSRRGYTDYRVCCSFCSKALGSADRRYKLYITPQINMYHCFRCSTSGAVTRLFQEFKHTPPVVDAIQHHAVLPGNIEPPGTLVPLTALQDDHICLRYLRGRNVDPAILDACYGARYCEEGRIMGGGFNTTGTIVFPFWMNEELVGWQARLLYNVDGLTEAHYEMYGFMKDEDGEWKVPSKYMTSPGLDKGRILFNYDYARTFNHVVICEGVFDAIAAGRSAVATLGKGVTEYQVRLIKAYWKFAVILLDPGDAEVEMLKLEQALSSSIPCVRISLKGYKDAGEMPTSAIWDQILNEMDRKNLSLDLLD